MEDFKATGGCFCGQNRFEITKAAVDTHHCHCSICQRMHGAPFATYSFFPKDSFVWTTGGDLDTFSASGKVHRNRCKNCGTPLTVLIDPMPQVIGVTLTSLDKGNVPGHPEETLRHAFWVDRVTWLDINDNVRKVDGMT